MDDIKTDLKARIVTHLNLEDVDPSEISDSGILFEELGLDSIDALELIVMLESEYGLKVTDPEHGRKIFRSIDSMAEFINEHK